ncbi:L-fuculose phosphate aldolase [Vibrio ishigakensis]|uniref:L-fuculose phosphate aldolase n=1 Tax=Vibrio ishigakensis TaxID=1481914 RepID=A0A0B8P0M2_9VIBR|nr:L-fuculose phosphate aldolase [Vibrio ishigakensis]
MCRKKLSEKIIKTCLEMNKLGLNQGTAGNVSVKFEDGMLITPSGIAYEKLTTDSIVFVEKNGTFEKGKIPSSEWMFHLECYKARDDINAVVHNHSINCAAVSILNKPIPAIHYMVAASGTTKIPCVPYATFGTETLSAHVSDGIKKSKAILLQHHGLIACGENLDKACGLHMKLMFSPTSTLRCFQSQNPHLSWMMTKCMWY